MREHLAPLRVRSARTDDAEAMARVLAEVAAERRWILTEAPVDVLSRAREIASAISAGMATCWLLMACSDVVGSLCLHRSMATGVADLGMAILAPFRGRGGGQALLRAAIEHAAATDLHKLQLEVFTDNARAITLYSRVGFVVEGVRQRRYRRADGSLKDVLVMARLLDGAPAWHHSCLT